MFDSSSRYAHIEVVTVIDGEGDTSAYIRRRFVPQPKGEIVAQAVTELGDRLDTVTAKVLTDPLQFWKVCDGNPVLNPFDLVEETGRTIYFRITGA
jgi:hypothetical protein